MSCAPFLKWKSSKKSASRATKAGIDDDLADKAISSPMSLRSKRVMLHGVLRSRCGERKSTGDSSYSRWKTRYWRLILAEDGLILQKSQTKTSKTTKSFFFPFGQCLIYESWGVTSDKHFRYGFTLRAKDSAADCDLVFEAAVRSAEARAVWMRFLKKAFDTQKSAIELYQMFYLWYARRIAVDNSKKRCHSVSSSSSASATSEASEVSLRSAFDALHMHCADLRTPESMRRVAGHGYNDSALPGFLHQRSWSSYCESSGTQAHLSSVTPLPSRHAPHLLHRRSRPSSLGAIAGSSETIRERRDFALIYAALDKDVDEDYVLNVCSFRDTADEESASLTRSNSVSVWGILSQGSQEEMTPEV